MANLLGDQFSAKYRGLCFPLWRHGKRTPAEVEELKARSLAGFSWMLEATEGLEAHREELRQFRHRVHAKGALAREPRCLNF